MIIDDKLARSIVSGGLLVILVYKKNKCWLNQLLLVTPTFIIKTNKPACQLTPYHREHFLLL